MLEKKTESQRTCVCGRICNDIALRQSSCGCGQLLLQLHQHFRARLIKCMVLSLIVDGRRGGRYVTPFPRAAAHSKCNSITPAARPHWWLIIGWQSSLASVMCPYTPPRHRVLQLEVGLISIAWFCTVLYRSAPFSIGQCSGRFCNRGIREAPYRE